MAALSTSIILRPVLLAVLLVDAAEAAENLKRRGEFLSSISAGGHFVTGFDKDKSRPSKPLLVRVPSRFFEASSACSSATHCSIICEELIGKGNDKAKVAPVVEEVERLEQQRLEAAAAGSRQTTTFKLEPCTAWNGGRGLGEIPGLELASLKKEQEGAATMRHLPGARFFHAFPRGSAFLARWDPIRELFVLLQRRFVQAVGYPLNAGELAGKLGPSRAYGVPPRRLPRRPRRPCRRPHRSRQGRSRRRSSGGQMSYPTRAASSSGRCSSLWAPSSC